MKRYFPKFIQDLAQAELPYEGLRGWIMQSESGQVFFNESDVKLVIPVHTHGDQWGIVMDGMTEITIGGVKNSLIKGDSYYIPANTPHSAVIYPGFKAVDCFAEKDRYKVHSSNV